MLFQMVYPGWPASLPSPMVVSHLVRTFLRRIAFPAAMFDQPRFLACLHLSPTHPNFPETALLHAICAFTADFVAEDELEAQDAWGRRYWQGHQSAKEYHHQMAKQAVQQNALDQRDSLQVSSITSILSQIY